MARTLSSFGRDIEEASLSVLLELWIVLRSYSEAMVLVGGWAPYFILKADQEPDNPFEHIGSIDIDVALNPALIDKRQYATILELITDRGFRQRMNASGQPIEFSFVRAVRQEPLGSVDVVIDFLGPEYGGTGRSRRHQRIQDELLVRKARGAEVVFSHNFSYLLNRVLPNGAQANADIQVADVVGCLTTKGIAIGQRYAEKDAYDIYSVVANYRRGPRDAGALLRQNLKNGLVQEAMRNIVAAFDSIRGRGPQWVADFLEVNPDGRDRIAAEAFAQVSRFLEEVGLKP
jgi:hypothetical protein